jgi:2-phosphosulfolactate phosphatase
MKSVFAELFAATLERSFELGNSPREFTREIVADKTIVMTTTNGTRALKTATRAGRILAASFLNLQATADWLVKEAPLELILICVGTEEEPAYEDALCAGALCDLLWEEWCEWGSSDSALIARKLFCQARHDLLGAMSQSRNGRRLLSLPDLSEDVQYCVQRDVLSTVLEMDSGGQVMPFGVAPAQS